MHYRYLVSGRQRATPHSSSFPPIEAPQQTLHLDVWGPARVRGQGEERYFLLVVDDYTRYTMVFPLRTKVQYAAHQLNLWPRVSAPETSPTLRWAGKVGDASVFRVWGCRAFVRDTSADKLSSRAVPCVFLRFVPDAPSWQFYHPTSRRVVPSQDVTFHKSVPFYRLFPYRTAPLPPPPLFLTPGAASVDPLPPQGPAPSGVSHVDPVEPVEVAVDSGPARGTASGGAKTGGAESRGAEPGGAEPGGAETGVAEPGGAETGGAKPGGAETDRAAPGGTPSSQQLHEWYSQCCSLQRGAVGAGGSAGVGAGGAAGALSRPEPPSPQWLREWYARCCSLRSGTPNSGVPPAGGPGAAGGTAASEPGGAHQGGPVAAGTGGSPGAGVGAGGAGAAGAAGGAEAAGPTGVGIAADPGVGVAGARAGGADARPPAGAGPDSAAGAGAAGGTGVGTTGAAGGATRVGAAGGGSGAVSASSGGASRPRPYFVPLLQRVLGQPPPPCPAPSLECPPLVHSQSQLQPASPLPGPSPNTGPIGGLTERQEPASRPVSPESRSVSPSDSLRAASPTVTRLLDTAITNPSFESAVASTLVAELVDFAAHWRLDYAARHVAES
ncbi:unnamed protein product [Closterium sp. NIES-65]|nr:unnamed protein product [Closterium sp. NIES-65]